MSIRLIILRDDDRAEVLLADVGRRLGVGPLRPDEHGDVHVQVDAQAEAEWQRVRDALDAAGDDWWAYVHLPRRP